MNINGYLKWRATIDEHYGRLDEFGDEQTVRFMLQGLKTALVDHRRVAAEIEQAPLRAEYEQTFEEEVRKAEAAIAELEAWFGIRLKRGLARLKAAGIEPSMSADELMRLTRGD